MVKHKGGRFIPFRVKGSRKSTLVQESLRRCNNVRLSTLYSGVTSRLTVKTKLTITR